jgi:predicted ArsR family transcriptional regulator
MDKRPDELPNELRAFIYSCIDSVEQAELLVLLCRSNRSWSTKAVAGELGLSDTAARHHLESLVARGLLHTTVGAEVSYSYAPKSADLRRYGDQLTEYYATARTAILRFIASSPRRVKRFSDAFKLRDPE